MDIEIMKNNDSLLGKSEEEVNKEMLEAIKPLAVLVMNSPTFRKALENEMQDAIDIERTGASVVTKLVEEFLELINIDLSEALEAMTIKGPALPDTTFRPFTMEPVTYWGGLYNLPNVDDYDPCSRCPNQGNSSCSCSLPSSRTMYHDPSF